METAREMIDRRLKEMKREREIHCPYCDYLQINDEGQYPVTYWGEGDESEEEMECGNDECGKKFHVKEKVDRTYEVEKIEQKESTNG